MDIAESVVPKCERCRGEEGEIDTILRSILHAFTKGHNDKGGIAESVVPKCERRLREEVERERYCTEIETSCFHEGSYQSETRGTSWVCGPLVNV